MATPTTPMPGEILTEVVQRLTQLYIDSFNRQDLDALLDFFASDAVMLGPAHPGVKGRTAIRELLKAMFAQGYSSMSLGRNSIANLGNLAVDIGYYTSSVTNWQGGKREELGKYVTAWRRQENGEFQITVTVWSTNL